MTMDMSKYVFPPSQGEVLTFGPPPNEDKIILLVDPKNTGETRFCTLLQVLSPGGVVPVHLHEQQEQTFFFYAGRATVIVGEQEFEGSPGTTVYVPPQVWHGFTNTGTEPLCILETTSPPGIENLFRELSQFSTPPDKEMMGQIMAKHGLKQRDS